MSIGRTEMIVTFLLIKRHSDIPFSTCLPLLCRFCPVGDKKNHSGTCPGVCNGRDLEELEMVLVTSPPDRFLKTLTRAPSTLDPPTSTMWARGLRH